MLAGRRRGRLLAASALLVPVAVVVGIVAGVGSSPSKSTAAGSSGGSDATTVQRRNLVETDTESGTLSFSNPQTVYDRSNGTITWLPSVGRVIKPGQTLFKVDGKPVILMDGTAPAYRDLAPSDGAGQDILQLNRDLVRLGFNPDGIVIDDEWQAATTGGVDVLQASLGETETGSLSLGQIVFLPGAQLVSAVDASLGSPGGSSGQGNASSSTNASNPAIVAAPEFVSLQTTTATSPPRPTTAHPPTAGTTTAGPTTAGTTSTGTTTTGTTPHERSRTGHRHERPSTSSPTTLQALIALLRAEITELRARNNHSSSTPQASSARASHSTHPDDSAGASASSNSNSGNASSSGSGGASASAVLQTTSTRLIVTVNLDASKQAEGKVGEPVTVVMPAGTTADGTISGVSPVALNSNSSSNTNGNGSGNGNGSNSSPGSTIPVTIKFKRHVRGAGLDQATVSVNFAQARANNVLSVPVTALLATSGGRYAVQEAATPHHLIPVTTGLFAAGYVQISGSGLHSGLRVTDSQG